MTASLPAIICRLNRTEEPILNPRTFSFWFKSFQTTTRHPHHLLPQSSILFSHEELVLRGWPPRSPRGPGCHVFSLSNNSSPTTFLSTALSLYRHSVCFWLEHVSIFARWLQLVCLVFVIWREWRKGWKSRQEMEEDGQKMCLETDVCSIIWRKETGIKGWGMGERFRKWNKNVEKSWSILMLPSTFLIQNRNDQTKGRNWLTKWQRKADRQF